VPTFCVATRNQDNLFLGEYDLVVSGTIRFVIAKLASPLAKKRQSEAAHVGINGRNGDPDFVGNIAD
jgi:hypothetical protein